MNQVINGLKEGYWEQHEDGILVSKGNYVNGLLEGYWEQYYSDGSIMYSANYTKNIRNGLCIFHTPNKKLSRISLYDNGFFFFRLTFYTYGSTQEIFI